MCEGDVECVRERMMEEEEGGDGQGVGGGGWGQRERHQEGLLKGVQENTRYYY